MCVAAMTPVGSFSSSPGSTSKRNGSGVETAVIPSGPARSQEVSQEGTHSQGTLKALKPPLPDPQSLPKLASTWTACRGVRAGSGMHARAVAPSLDLHRLRRPGSRPNSSESGHPLTFTRPLAAHAAMRHAHYCGHAMLSRKRRLRPVCRVSRSAVGQPFVFVILSRVYLCPTK